jgi:hypothetical protein
MKRTCTTLLILCCLATFGQQQRIPLNANDAFANQHNKDDFSKLSDSDITTHYTVWSPAITPYRVTFDLINFDNCIIKQIKYFVNNGNPSQLKYIIRTATGEEKLLFSYTGGNWNPTWQTVNLDNTVAAKQFIIESPGNADFPDDIQLFGTYTTHTWPVIKQNLPLSDLMGVVVKPWDIASDYIFPEKIPSIVELGAKRIRLYNDYQLNHDASGNLIFDNGLWHQTSNMKLLKDKGISTQMCYLSTPYYPFTADRLNVETYLPLAKDIYAFGVHNKANGEYFKTIEVENEIDKWYSANPALEYMDGYQLAALMSMCYDGHKGKYPNVGLKASGSTALVSAPGMAEGEPYLLYQMMEWCIKNRGYRTDGTPDFPFDIYSFHCYSSLEGQRQGIPGGISPEYGMSQYLEKINTFRKRYAPWMKIHVGEWGWDISENSPLNAPAFGKYSANQVSAMWTVRALLGMAENEINASSYYRIKQDYDALDDGSWIPFATMALLRQYSEGAKQPDGSYLGFDFKRTPTGDYFKQLSQFFSEGWVFDSRVSTSPNVLKFKKGTSEAYVIWETETMAITDKPQFQEKTNTYTLLKSGSIKRFVDDGSGAMSSTGYIAGTPLAIDAKPIIITTDLVILPLRDTAGISRPFIPELFNVELYDFMGVLLLKKKDVNLVEFKKQLRRKKLFILKYYNAKKNVTEKIYKL